MESGGSSSLGEDQTSPQNNAKTSPLGEVWTASRLEAGGDRTFSLGEDPTTPRHASSGELEVWTSSGMEARENRSSSLGEDLISSRSIAGQNKIPVKEELIWCCTCGKSTPFKTQSDKIVYNEKPFVCSICETECSSLERDEASTIRSEAAFHVGNGMPSLGEDRTPLRSDDGGNETSALGDNLTFLRGAYGNDGSLTSLTNHAEGNQASSLEEECTFFRADSEGYSPLGGGLASSPGNNDDDPSLQCEGSLLGGDVLALKDENVSQHQDSTHHSAAVTTFSEGPRLHLKRLSLISLQCDICDKIFCNAYSLKRHKRVHNNDKPFCCDICGKAFSFRYSLNRHKRLHVNAETTSKHSLAGGCECRSCGQYQPSVSALARHVKMVHPGEKAFICHTCGKGFLSMYNLRRHEKCHRTIKETTSKPLSKVVGHQKAGKTATCNVQEVECRFCGQSLSSANCLLRHVRQAHPGKKPYSCKICGKGFLNKFNLKRHRCVHTRKETITSTESPGSLNLPQNQIPRKTATCNVQEVECRFCGQSQFSAVGLLKHVRQAHPGKKPYSCKICGNGFLTKFNLKRHRDVHTMKEVTIPTESPGPVQLPNASDVECGTTGQSPLSTDSLLRPIRRNDLGENAHTFRKAFKHSYPLRHTTLRALRNNDGTLSRESSKLAKCEFCGKYFTCRDILKRHQSEHCRKDSPNEIGGEGVNGLSNVKRHLKLQRDTMEAPDTSISCEFCGKFFKMGYSMKVHLNRNHKPITSGKSATAPKSLQVKQDCLSSPEVKHHKCEFCYRHFIDAYSVKMHCKYNKLYGMESYPENGERGATPLKKGSFVCDVCDKMFPNLLSLRSHNFDVHSLDRFFACGMCGKAFLCQRTLRTHCLVHHKKEATAAGILLVDSESSLEKRTTIEYETCSDVQVNPDLSRDGAVAHEDNNVITSNESSFNRSNIDGQDAVHIQQEPSDVDIHEDATQGVSPSLNRVGQTGDSVCIKVEGDSDDLCGKSSLPSSSDSCPSTSSNLDDQQGLQAGQTSFKCTGCEQVFALKVHLESHQCIHAKQRKFVCKTCGKSFCTRFPLVEHQRIHSNERPYTCEYCFKPLRYYSCLIRHMKLHEKKDSSQLQVCQMADRNLSEAKCFVCRLCKKSFKRASNLKTHYYNLHIKNKTPFACEICNKSYKSKFSLLCHKSNVHRKKTLLCEVCGKQFRSITTLKLHLRSHNGEKPYRCKLCVASFSQQSSLQRHQRIHTNEKPYVCELCGKAFSQDCSLKRHLKVHKKRSESQWDAETDSEGGDGSDNDGASLGSEVEADCDRASGSEVEDDADGASGSEVEDDADWESGSEVEDDADEASGSEIEG